MSAPEGLALSSIAFQLAAAVDAYEQDLDTLLCKPLDVAAHDRASHRMDEMRRYAAALPALSVCWVELMIRHFELMHASWRLRLQPGAAADLERLHANVRSAAGLLARRCVQLLPRA